MDQYQARIIPGRCGKNEGTARCWNNGELYGDLGDLFLMLLKMKQHIPCEIEGVPIRLSNPFMETIRLRGLDLQGGDLMDDPSFSIILTACGNGCRYYEGHSNFTQNEDIDASRSESSGSMSPDLGEIWGYGCSMSPACGSQSDFDKPERPEKPEESDAHGSDSFNSSVKR